MRVLVAKNGNVLPGMGELFKKAVERNKKALIEADAWLRENIPSYKEEVERLTPNWDEEATEDLFISAERYGDGGVYYDDEQECDK